MAWLLDKTTEQHGGRLLAFSTPYSMMGWMIANKLNDLRLDVLWLLPLVIYGLMVILDGRGWRFYLTALAVTMIDNYYMAWMVALFTLLFASWYLTTTKEPWRPRVTAFSRYLLASIGAATTIRISHCYGARSLKEPTLAAKASYHLVIAWNLFAAITFISLCNVIPTFFTTNAEVIDLASKLILLIAVYQLADGIQNDSVGILRGIQDVKIIMPIAFLSYIVFNLPVGYLLGFT